MHSDGRRKTVRSTVAPLGALNHAGMLEQDEEWVLKQRKGRETDAILSCPCCLETLCLECQRRATHHKTTHQELRREGIRPIICALWYLSVWEGGYHAQTEGFDSFLRRW
jgi:hypothetical protein